MKFSVEAHIRKWEDGIDEADPGYECGYEDDYIVAVCSEPFWGIEEYFCEFNIGYYALIGLLEDKPEGTYHIYAEGHVEVTYSSNPEWPDDDIDLILDYHNVTDISAASAPVSVPLNLI